MAGSHKRKHTDADAVGRNLRSRPGVDTTNQEDVGSSNDTNNTHDLTREPSPDQGTSTTTDRTTHVQSERSLSPELQLSAASELQKWLTNQHSTYLKGLIEEQFGDLNPRDGRTILKWIVALNKFFDHYQGIKDYVLDPVKFNEGDKKIKRIFAPNPETYAEYLCDDLASLLQEQHMPHGRISTQATELTLKEIWDYLYKFPFPDLAPIMEEILVELCYKIYKSETVGDFILAIQSFKSRPDNPLYDFIKLLDVTEVAVTYFWARWCHYGKIFIRHCAKHYREYRRNPNIKIMTCYDLDQAAQNDPDAKPVFGEDQSLNVLYTPVKVRELDPKLKAEMNENKAKRAKQGGGKKGKGAKNKKNADKETDDKLSDLIAKLKGKMKDDPSLVDTLKTFVDLSSKSLVKSESKST